MSVEHGGTPPPRLSVDRLPDLAGLPPLQPGTEVWIPDRRELVYSVGQLTPSIASALRWSEANVWLPESARLRIELKHPRLIDVVRAASTLLEEPTSVHEDRELADAVYFIIRAETLRERGLLTSRSARHVDLVVQSHRAGGVILRRAFHLSPARQNRGGPQLWP